MASPRSVWSGAVSFGLVNVPVGLVPAVSPSEVKFSTFSPAGNPMGRREIDKVTGEDVARGEQVRGRKVGDSIVTISDEEIDALAPAASRSISIELFVDASQVSALFFEKHFYLVPLKGGEQPYAVLASALASTSKVGIGKVVMRSKEHVVALRHQDGVLVMTLLSYHDEVRAVADLGIRPVVVDERYVDLATQLVEALSGEWVPTEYEDTQRVRVEALIASKASGLAPAAVAEGKPAEVTNLLDALAASLAASKVAAKPLLRAV